MYTYVGNNPVNFIDPTGHNSCTPEDLKVGACTVKDGAPIPDLPDFDVEAYRNATGQERLDMLVASFKASVRATGVPRQLSAVQWAIETGWGEKRVPTDVNTGQNSNNLFGTKGTGPASSVLDWGEEDYGDGLKPYLMDWRAYYSPVDSIFDHGQVRLEPQYAEAFTCGDLNCWAQTVPPVYATGKSYVNTATAIMSEQGWIE